MYKMCAHLGCLSWFGGGTLWFNIIVHHHHHHHQVDCSKNRLMVKKEGAG